MPYNFSHLDLIQGALFHDIGKLFYKAGTGTNHKNAGVEAVKHIWFADEVNRCVFMPIVEQGILLHHAKDLKDAKNDVDADAYLIYEADNIAAAVDRHDLGEGEDEAYQKAEGYAAFKKYRRVYPVFMELLKGKGKTKQYFKHEVLCTDDAVGYEPVYPVLEKEVAELGKQDYQALERFWNEQIQSETNKTVLRENPNAILQLMEATLSFACADTNTGRSGDVNLFDHLKLTACLAHAMKVYDESAKPKIESAEGKKNRYFNTETIENFRKEKGFALVGLDISGIQSFIYNVATKGALKNLRGRSFYLELLTEHVVDEALELLGNYSRASLLYSGGGRAYLLVGNEDKYVEGEAPEESISIKVKLDELKTRFDDWSFKTLKGEISLNVAHVTCTAHDLMGIDLKGKKIDFEGKDENDKPIRHPLKIKWKELTEKLGKAKSIPFDGVNFNDLFSPQSTAGRDAENKSKNCRITGADWDLIPCKDEADKYVNRFALGLEELGKNLPKGKNFILVKPFKSHNDETGTISLPNLKEGGIDFVLELKKDSVKDLSLGEKDRLYSINSPSLHENCHANLLVGDYYPEHLLEEDEKQIEKGHFALPSFETMANKSKGLKAIGVFRADVDNLGSLFGSGFENKTYSLSRVALLSKHLNMFFKVYLNHLLKNPLAYFDKNSKTLPNLGEHLLETLKILVDEDDLEQGLNVVIVYSGGDDLFLVGSWNHCLAASLLIREAFRAYTLDTLTFSGGFEVFNPHMPLKALAERVGESETKAKAFGKDDRGNPTKDAFCLFHNEKSKYQDTHQWCCLLNELADALPMLTSGKGNDSNTSGFIYQLYQLGQEILEGNALPIARLHYLFERQLEACGGNKDRKEQLKDLKRKLLDENLDIEKTQENFKSYKTPFFIATYLHRTK